MPDFARAYLLIRVSAIALIAAAAAGCSDLPEWMGGDPAPAAQPAPSPDSIGTSDSSTPQGKTVAEASDRYPVLADTPGKAPPSTSSDEQKQVANALVADRTQTQYSAEALQAGTITPAEPPPPASAEPSAPIPPPSSSDAASTGSAAAAPASSPAPAQMASGEPQGRAPMPGTLPIEGASPPPAAQVATAGPAVSSVPMPPPAAAPAPAPASATPTPPPPPVAAAPSPSAIASGDAALGFQPSHAPPLDPAVARLMGNPAPQRSQRLASIATPAAAPSYSYTQPGGPPAAVVMFPTNTIGLDANGVAQVQTAVAAWRAKGEQGYVRVVGHSASGAPNLPADRQMTQSLERSQACATAVARELIKDGVPANRVLVDASATLSEAEQRRAEIFLQS